MEGAGSGDAEGPSPSNPLTPDCFRPYCEFSCGAPLLVEHRFARRVEDDRQAVPQLLGAERQAQMHESSLEDFGLP